MAPCAARTASSPKSTPRPLARRQPRRLPSLTPRDTVAFVDTPPVSRPKALFVTISDYPDPDKYHTLNTVHDDLKNLQDYLQYDKKYVAEDVHILRCDSPELSLRPTKANILREIDWLVEGTGAGDFRIFYYAGHVAQRPTTSKTERDSMDEAIVTADVEDSHHPRKNLVLDNELRVRLVNGMGRGSTLVAILEGCHSETLLDLDTTRMFSPTDRASFGDVTNLPALSSTRRLKTDHAVQRERGASLARRHSGPSVYDCTLTRGIFGVMKRCASPASCRTISEYANVVSISACLDSEKSTTNDKTMVYLLIELFRANANSPLTPRTLQRCIAERLVEEKLKTVRCKFRGPLTLEDDTEIRTMQNPKVSTLRGSTYLLDEPLIIPSASVREF